jgi:hypothetical protein
MDFQERIDKTTEETYEYFHASLEIVKKAITETRDHFEKLVGAKFDKVVSESGPTEFKLKTGATIFWAKPSMKYDTTSKNGASVLVTKRDDYPVASVPDPKPRGPRKDVKGNIITGENKVYPWRLKKNWNGSREKFIKHYERL